MKKIMNIAECINSVAKKIQTVQINILNANYFKSCVKSMRIYLLYLLVEAHVSE